MSGARDVVRNLRRDGVPIGDDAHLTGPLPSAALELADLDLLGDPGDLEEYLDRMRGNLDHDTPAVIGAAKELIEAVCKRILDERGSRIPSGRIPPRPLPGGQPRAAPLARLGPRQRQGQRGRAARPSGVGDHGAEPSPKCATR